LRKACEGKIKFWKDSWIGDMPLDMMFLRLCVMSDLKDKKIVEARE